MRWKQLFVLSLLIFVAIARPPVQAEMRQGTSDSVQSAREGSWSARSASGLTLRGTWTAVSDAKTGAVTGTWTLDDAQGKTVRRGAWSAAKSAKGWTGAWRAIVTGQKGEFAGTWDASVELKPNAAFADLFELAAKSVVSGSWRAGGQSGAWSIRAFK